MAGHTGEDATDLAPELTDGAGGGLAQARLLGNAGRGLFEDGQILPDGPNYRCNEPSTTRELQQQRRGISVQAAVMAMRS